MKKTLMFAITLGVGIGLVFSSGVALILQPDDTSKVSEDFIKSEAKKLGMIEPSEYIDKKQLFMYAKCKQRNFKEQGGRIK